MASKLLKFREKHPFLSVLTIAFLIRLLAVLFAKGYGFDSEHFLYVETPNAWIDNIEYQHLNLDNVIQDYPQGRSLFYVSINYLWFGFLKIFGITNPQLLMFFSRLLHAFISLFVISFAYRITDLLSDKKTAWWAALILSVYWFMPYVSVHNIASFVCVPFLMYGTLIILRQEVLRKAQLEKNLHRSSFAIAGFFLGLGFCVWYQSILYLFGILLALSILKNWKGAMMTFIGMLVAIGIVQIIPDLIVWGRPFAELRAFISSSTNYIFNASPHSPWIYYSFLTIIMALIPPFSLMLMWGFFRNWRKNLLLFLPTFLFLLYYTIFPNKNEIYILPVIPTFIVLGIVGWENFIKSSHFWQKNIRLYKYTMGFMALINIVGLVATVPMYSNKPEVKAMTYISKFKNTDSFVIDDKCCSKSKNPPVFYAKKWPNYTIVNLSNELKMNEFNLINKDVDFVLFRESKN